jgi:dienelactone hydrolase
MRHALIPPTEQITARIRTLDVDIPADISIPKNPRGLILFALTPGARRRSPANRRVADILNQSGYATALADLMADQESTRNARTGELCSGLDLLVRRMVALTDWIAMQPVFQDMPVGYFGAGSGAEAALIAAAKRPEVIRAVVSCGARLERAGASLGEIDAPVLVIAGSEDPSLLASQRAMMTRLPEWTHSQLEVIDGIADPFSDPHAVQRLARSTRSWYQRHFSKSAEPMEHATLSAS